MKTRIAWLGFVIAVAGCMIEPPSASRSERVYARRSALVQDGGSAGGCGPVTSSGCCAGQTLVYCAADGLRAEDCPAHGMVCGWSTTYGVYACGSSTAVDPSGVAPRECPDHDAGLVAADSALADAAQDAAVVDGGGDASSSCGPLQHVGCCEGDEVLFCSGGQVLSLLCSPGTCGWNPDAKYYGCDTTGEEDSDHPRACAVVLGDAGLPLVDGGPGSSDASDAGSGLDPTDAGPARDARAGKDGFVVEGDALTRPRETGPTDAVGRDLPRLDAVGLDVSRTDGRVGEDAAGCSCRAGGSTVDPLPGLLPALLLGVLPAWIVAARGRGRRGRPQR